MKSHLDGAYAPKHTQYNTFAAIYTASHLIKLNRIRLPGPDSFKKRNNFEFPNTVLMNGISEFSCEIFNKEEQTPSLTCFPIYYRKVRIIKNKKEYIFYILDDLVKNKLDEYGYLNRNDNTIMEMLKKYKYLEEDEK